MLLLTRRLAIAGCLAMLALQVLLQFVLTPGRAAPTALFALFSLLWAFGAAMLRFHPWFGALGTALWGMLAVIGAARTHEGTWEGTVLILGSGLTAIFAAWHLLVLRRVSGAA